MWRNLPECEPPSSPSLQKAVTTDGKVTKNRRQVVHLDKTTKTHKSRQSKHGLHRLIGLAGTLRVPEFPTVTSLTFDTSLYTPSFPSIAIREAFLSLLNSRRVVLLLLAR
jgi:hypothetical protein